MTQVLAPTLMIVGGNDVPVIALNKQALARLRSEKQLVIVPCATHLFEELGALDAVATLARLVPALPAEMRVAPRGRRDSDRFCRNDEPAHWRG